MANTIHGTKAPENAGGSKSDTAHSVSSRPRVQTALNIFVHGIPAALATISGYLHKIAVAPPKRGHPSVYVRIS